MTFLFIATLGPVQPFIASSRRTRDLFAGSMLLSELSRAAAHEIAQREKAGIKSLIFPAPLKMEELGGVDTRPLNVANKIVAMVEQLPDELGNAVHEAVQERLRKIKEDAFRDIPTSNDEAANEQIRHLVEYAWVAVPFDEDAGYKHARERAEAVLSARKNTNFFHEVTWGSNQEKSSIDGRLECVIPAVKYPKTKEEYATEAKYRYETYKAGPHERLSAVDLLKRLGLTSMHLPVLSTSHIAATPFLERLLTMSQEDQTKARGLWNEYIQKVEMLAPSSSIVERIPQSHPVTGNVDGALLFEERLLEDIVERHKFPAAKEALRTFFCFTDERLNSLRPSPYYVVLLADGDGMGKAIEVQAERGPDGHRQISQALAGFAEQVFAVVKKHRGALVYAGGDDVLALLPLHTALACARELAQAFKEKLSTFKYEGSNTPTLSAGMAVVHHVSLLQDALTLARRAERQAKNQPQKNALAITVQKRGGEPASTVVSWSNREMFNMEVFSTLIALCQAEIIPGGMPYELRHMVRRLQTRSDDPEFTTLQKVIQIEAARVVRRKLYFSQHRTASQSLDQLEQQLSQFFPDPIPQKDGNMQYIPTTLQERALTFLLSRIGIEQHATKSFVVTSPENIALFVDRLIVAQVFAETLTRNVAKGATE